MAEDWEYRCMDCPHVVLAGADFNEPCPKCGGHRWICHWLRRPGATAAKSADGAAQDNNCNNKGWDKTPDDKTDSPPILSQPYKPVDGAQHQNGRRRRVVPGELITQLSQQGLSSREIAADLAARGFSMSYKSVQRYLRTRSQGALI